MICEIRFDKIGLLKVLSKIKLKIIEINKVWKIANKLTKEKIKSDLFWDCFELIKTNFLESIYAVNMPNK